LSELGDAFRRKGKADGVGVAAEPGEQGSVGGVDGGESIEQMKAGDGATGAVGFAFFMGEDESGTPGAIDDTGGKDADHATVPGTMGRLADGG
jgi:hypothetical protein